MPGREKRSRGRRRGAGFVPIPQEPQPGRGGGGRGAPTPARIDAPLGGRPQGRGSRRVLPRLFAAGNERPDVLLGSSFLFKKTFFFFLPLVQLACLQEGIELRVCRDSSDKGGGGRAQN